MWFYFWLLKLLKEWLQRGCQSFAKNTILLQGQEIILKMGKSNWSWQKMILRQLKFVLHLRFAASTTMGKLLEIYWGEVMGRSMTLLLLLSIRALTFGFVPSLLSQHFPPQFSWHSPPPLSIIIMLAKIIYVYEHASWISHEYSAFSTKFLSDMKTVQALLRETSFFPHFFLSRFRISTQGSFFGCWSGERHGIPPYYNPRTHSRKVRQKSGAITSYATRKSIVYFQTRGPNWKCVIKILLPIL